MNTRTNDLDRIDAASRSRNKEESVDRMKAILVNVYEQSKDPILEGLKIQLAQVINKLNTLDDPSKFDECYRKYWEIHDKVIAYTSTTSFRENIARKISQQVGRKQADRYFDESERG